VEPDKFRTLMSLLAARAKDLGFLNANGIAMVPTDLANPANGDIIDSINDYGTASMDQITEWERTFVATNTRRAQDSKILFQILLGSLSVDGITRVETWKEQYMLTIVVNNVSRDYESGGCLLKVIVRESYLDSTATVSSIRLALSSLDHYVNNHGTDVVDLNSHARRLIDGLRARRETSQDLLVNLFKAYKCCKDPKFLDYVTGIENAHDDGTAPMTADRIMIRTNNYYRKRIETPTEPWEGSDQTQNELQAMQSQIDALEKKVKEAKANLSKKKGSTNKGSANKKGGGKKKDRAQPVKPNWILNNEKPDDPSVPRAWNGAVWWWCDDVTGGKCGGAWGTHQPSKCEGKRGKRKGDSNSLSKQRAKALKTIKAQQALLQSLADQGGDDSDTE
jgi:hypothetical protein